MPFDVNEEKNSSSTTIHVHQMYFTLHYIKLQTTKMNLEKIVGLKSFQKRSISIWLNLLQVCSSLPNFVFALLLISSVYN